MAVEYIKRIAIVGGAGNIGKPVVANLLDTNRFQMTAISRPDSNTTFPEGVTVARGNYDDDEFLLQTLTGQDVLIILLGYKAAPQIQADFIKAAAKAGVQWILPTEFGSDTQNPKLAAINEIFAKKQKTREFIEELGVSSWIGIAHNPLYEMCLPLGMFHVDFKNRKATLYDGGNTKFSTSTYETVGRGVAALLSLPVEPVSAGDPSLSRFRNGFAYFSTFRLSQREMLDAVQRATKTTDNDWTIEQASTADTLAQSDEAWEKGDFAAVTNRMFVSHFVEGLGGDFVPTKGNLAEELGVPKEDLDEVTERIVANA